MTNEQTIALELLLMRYRESVINTNTAMDEPNNVYVPAHDAEDTWRKEIFDYVDSMLASASKEAAGSVLDKSFWSA